MKAAATLAPQFLETPKGALFALLYQPVEAPNGKVILLLPPFAEELNKSRRQCALQARRWCAQGYTVAMVDLIGTGDSEGQFATVRMNDWQDNLASVFTWFAGEGFTEVNLWAIRFGALLLESALAVATLPIGDIILWQPVLSGKPMLQQFIRIATAATMLKGQEDNAASDPMQQLKEHGLTEVAGYQINADLFDDIAACKLSTLTFDSAQRVHWCHVAASANASLPPPVTKLTTAWAEQGAKVSVHVVNGDAFWTTTEITTNQELLDVTTNQTTEIP